MYLFVCTFSYQPTPASPPASPSAGASASASASACGSVDVFQYAVAIRVPRQLCEANSGQQITGLPDRNAVINALNIRDNKATRLYVSDNLVAARPQGEGTRAVHSERKLLMEKVGNTQQTPMERLIENHHDDCVVFYTYNSPCMDFCLNQKGDDNEDNKVKIKTERNEKNMRKGNPPVQVSPAVHKCITAPLQRLFSSHNGPKAFVFNEIYVKDASKPDRLKALLPLAQVMPLFHCPTGQACVSCGSTEDSLKTNHC